MKQTTSGGDAGNATRNAGSAEKLEEYLVEQLATGVAALPLLPPAAAEALRLASDPQSDLGELASLVERDPPLAARLLSFANSAANTRSEKALDVRSAIVRLGLANARDLLFQVVYANAMFGMPRYHAQVAVCFRRSVLAAIGARFLDEATGSAHPYSYLCGLLHDVGEGRVYRILAAKPPPAEGLDAVDAIVVRHHTSAGVELAKAWRLPSDIVSACYNHHQDPKTLNGVVRLVAIADVLVRVAEHRQSEELSAADEAILEALRLPRDLAARTLVTLRETAAHL
jgi:HD-like signal output (HDOD) protein